jgi:hypothetical protein
MNPEPTDVDRPAATRQGALWAAAETGFDNDRYLADQTAAGH